MNNEVVTFPVFRDKSGNRFIFPTVFTSTVPDRKSMSVSDIWAYSLTLQTSLGCQRERFDFSAELDETDHFNFPYIPSVATASGFAHGAATTWVIGGPLFDDIVSSK